MSIDDFVRYSKVLHALTADFARAVPEDKWNFTQTHLEDLAAHQRYIGLGTASRRFASNCGTSSVSEVSTLRHWR